MFNKIHVKIYLERLTPDTVDISFGKDQGKPSLSGSLDNGSLGQIGLDVFGFGADDHTGFGRQVRLGDGGFGVGRDQVWLGGWQLWRDLVMKKSKV